AQCLVVRKLRCCPLVSLRLLDLCSHRHANQSAIRSSNLLQGDALWTSAHLPEARVLTDIEAKLNALRPTPSSRQFGLFCASRVPYSSRWADQPGNNDPRQAEHVRCGQACGLSFHQSVRPDIHESQSSGG